MGVQGEAPLGHIRTARSVVERGGPLAFILPKILPPEASRAIRCYLVQFKPLIMIVKSIPS